MSLAVDAEALMRLVHDVCKNAGMTTVVVTHDAQPRPRRTG
jgi:ABC-type lipoprotein export system ATPase subunit